VSLRNTARAVPTLMRIGFAEALAYRAEFFVWILATTMPLIMLALWSTVAREAPIGRFGEQQFVAYFVATFIVRQLTFSWASWQMNYEVRTGTMAARLLRPVHPVAAYAIENWAALPLRLVVALPLGALALWAVGSRLIPSTAAMWCIWLASVVGAWAIGFLANVAVGSLSFFMESSVKVIDAWLAAFFVFSGYLIPVELFPHMLQATINWLPFRYQLGLPVEIMTGAYAPSAALAMLARQWAYVLVLLAITSVLWNRGLRRFEADGG
jgi:ABC-2 type transport system permease protein